jgi:hypothetical protein
MEVGCTSLGSFSARSTTEWLPAIEDEYRSFGKLRPGSLTPSA